MTHFCYSGTEESRPQGPSALAYASGYHGDEIAVDPVAHILTTDPYIS